MSDTRRLVDEGSSPAVMALLRAARSDAPPDAAAKAKALSALVAAAATGAIVGKGSGAAGVVAKVLSHSGAKLVLAIALGGSVGAATLVLMHRRDHRDLAPHAASGSAEQPHAPFSGQAPLAPVPQLEPIPQAAAPRPFESPRPSQSQPAAVPVDTSHAPASSRVASSPAATEVAAARSLPPSSPPAHDVPSPPSPELSEASRVGESRAAPELMAGGIDAPPLPLPAPSSPALSSLSSETRMLDEARAAVALRDGKAALVTIDRYRSMFPHGVFTTDFTVLRIEALFETGDRAHAIQLANDFLKGGPNGPYAKRIRELLAKD
jgi:hypothetical protein